MNPLGAVLVGLVLLASAGCGEGSSSTPVGDGPSPPAMGGDTSFPGTGSTVPTTATLTTSAAGEGLCAGDQAAARTVAVYRAMLTNKELPVEVPGKPSRLYVSSQWLDDSFQGPGSRVGQIEASVLRCLSAGVPGLPPIVVVSGPADPAIRTVPSSGIRGFADNAKYVTFGDVSSGDPATSYVTVDAGEGDVAGGKYLLRLRGAEVVSMSSSERWTS